MSSTPTIDHPRLVTVCEYFVMMRYFNDLGITAHNKDLYDMGIKPKEHEVCSQKSLESNQLLPWFERIFGGGTRHSYNDVDLDNTSPVEQSQGYGRHRKATDRE